MKKSVLGGCAVIGGLAIVAVLAVAVVAAMFWSVSRSVPAGTILEVDLEQALPETAPDDPISQALRGEVFTLRDAVDALEKASGDDRVKGLVARVGNSGMGLAQIQEIRDAVQRFRKSGKPAVAWSETFGEFSAGNGAYYLATAFDTVWLQPSGDVGLNGLQYESPFVKGVLDKLGIVPRMDHRHEYKNAMNLYTETRFTDPHREALDVLMRSQFDQMVRGISEGRKLEPPVVRALADRGPFLGQAAVDAKLVDGLAYRDEVLERVRSDTGEHADLLYLSKYLQRAGRPHKKGKVVALIYGVGGVVRGRGGYDPILGSQVMGSDGVSSAFRSAIKDEDVRAIVFRVDSPGGSYVASDTIWRETQRARKAGKPVIVTMGDVAGSGGYFVAMGADKIVAQPGTITGSIGVLGGKLLTQQMWAKIGLSFDEVHTSENASMFNPSTDYSPQEWAKFQEWLDRVYADFTSKVAEGRALPKEKVLDIAKGRIWTGEDAKGLGLVDALGGLTEAVALAKEAAKIPADAPIEIRTFPRKRSLWETLQDKGPDSSENDEAVAASLPSLKRLRPVLRTLAALAAEPEDRVLTMPLEVAAP